MILKNRVAIITGAGSGIGKASAKLFAKEGANVVVADINEETGLEVVKDITALGGDKLLS
jgi:NAD(P)-dependent dehydrogenase (short-subunit alcohol dehydrogenase family)